MSAAERRDVTRDASASPRRLATAARAASRWALAGGAVVAAARSLLRIWGVEPRPAVRLQRRRERALRAEGDRALRPRLNPDYFVNPPAFTYLLHACFARLVRRARRRSATRSRADPDGGLRPRPRRRAALLGTLASGCSYLAGARLFDRRVGLLAAALLAVAFLPVFYSPPRAQRRPDARAGRASRCGRGGRRCATAGRATTRSPGIGLGLAARDEVHGRDRAAAAAGGGGRVSRAARHGRGAARARARRGASRAVAFLDRQPLRAARLRRLPRRPRPPADGRRRRAAASSGSPSTTAPLLPVDAHLGARLGPARRRARRRACCWRARPAAGAGAARPRRSSSSSSWARRSASSAAGCCRSSRSSCLLAAYGALAPRRCGAPPRPAAAPALAGASPSLALCGQGLVSRCTTTACSRGRHARADARLDGDQRPARARSRRRAGRRPTAGRRTSARPSRVTGNGNRWIKFPTSALADRPTTAPSCGRRPGASSSSRTTSARCARARSTRYERSGLLLGRHRLDPARPRARPSPTRSRRAIALLPRARARAPRWSSAPRRTRRGRQAGDVQLRLVVRLLPARLRRARDRDAVYRLTGGRCAGRIRE